MPDNLQASDEPSVHASIERFSPLPGFRVVALAGRDATTFAQAQFMNEVATLEAGHWQWNGWLTPKGRLLALFALVKREQDSLWLLLPDADPAPLADAMRRFVFRSKVTLSVRDDLQAAGRFSTPDAAAGNRIASPRPEAIELDLGADGGARTLRIEPGQADDDDAVVSVRWQAFDLAHGLPRLAATQVGRWTPQQLSLQRLRAYSVRKGCYPGQEIVARTHFLGKSKRQLVRLRLHAPVEADADVLLDGAVIGTVVDAAAGGEGQPPEALAVVTEAQALAALCVDGKRVAILPLLDGLDR